MLVRVGQFLYLQELGLADKAIDVNAQGMCRQLGIQTCAKAQKPVWPRCGVTEKTKPELPRGGSVEGGLTRRGNGRARGSPLHGQSVAQLNTLFSTGVSEILFTNVTS